ncbi:hypothetical protein C4579_01680 [Candidatus Microgenomates bacterium]|nr:MAG: hypothetical protein C4579_01680 [Candidatus Microgenomates bacterium]
MDEEQLKQKEQEELRALLDAPDDEEESSGDDQKNKNDAPPADENSNDDDKNKSKSSEEDEQDDKGNKDKKDSKDKGKGENKDRWNGKSREEVIKEYEAMEARISALESKDPNKKDETESGKAKDDGEKLDLPTAEELQKMTPSDFAKWVISRIDEGVKKTIDVQEKIRESVRKEIAEAKKEHPLQDPDYRKMVQTIMDAASAKGTTVSLKEACVQVDAFLGKHKAKDDADTEDESEELSDEEKSRLKKAKAQVESGAGAPTQPDGSDAETKRIQKALAGSGSKSPLGGLGI